MGILDLSADRFDRTPINPLPSTPRGFDETFWLALESHRQTDQFFSRENAIYDAYERAGEALHGATGQRLRNPMASAPAPAPVSGLPIVGLLFPQVRRADRTAFDEALRTARAAGHDVPDPDRIQADIAERAQRASRALASATATPTWGSTLGGFAGSAAGAMTDPVNLATLPIGAPARLAGGVARQVLMASLLEGTAAGASQALIETRAAPYRAELGVAGDPLGNIVAAATGGAVLGGGLRGLIAAIRLARGGSPPTLGERDAITIGARAESETISNPGGPARAAQHEFALDTADAAVRSGRLAEVEPVPQARAAPAAGDTPTRVYTAAGRAIEVEHQVVELASLIPSHTDDLRVNPAFPADIQPRQRERAASEAQIAEIAGRLEPERLAPSADAATGAPIIGPDQVVESGNGRVLALRRAYADGGERTTAYRAWLASRGHDTAGMAQPVLVARRVTALDTEGRIAFAREANAPTAMALAAGERAMADARTLDPILDLWRGGDAAAGPNREFREAFARGLPASERGALTTARGDLSAEGKRRIEGALLARAYGDQAPALIGKLLEATDNDIKAIAGALQDVAAGWAQMRARAARGEIADGMDITADLIAAVRAVEDSRAAGQRVADRLAQGDIFNNGMTDTARALLASFFRDPQFRTPAGRKPIAERLTAYVDEANKSQPGANLFGDAPPTGADVLRAHSIAEAARAEQVARAAPEMAQMTLRDAQRVAAERDPDIPTTAENTKGEVVVVGFRKASQALDEAEQGVATAGEVAACILGQAAD